MNLAPDSLCNNGSEKIFSGTAQVSRHLKGSVWLKESLQWSKMLIFFLNFQYSYTEDLLCVRLNKDDNSNNLAVL